MTAPRHQGRCLKNHALCQEMGDWFRSPLGAALIESERQAVAEATRSLFGVRQLEVGITAGLGIGTLGNFGHRVSSVGSWDPELNDSTMVAAPEELSLPNDCIDLAILHHTLDFTSHPHQALREASRVLRGGGHLLIVGFNPVSLWGWRRMVSKGNQGPWQARFLSRKRIEDWLEVLDFVVEDRQMGFYRPPLQNPGMLERFQGLERLGQRGTVPGGAYYVLVAEKRVGARIRQRPVWVRKNVIAMPVANRQRPASCNKERT